VVLTKSKIFLYFCFSFIIGVAIASFIKIPLLVSGVFLIVGLLLIVLFWQRKWDLVVVGFCLLFLIAGIWRFNEKSKILENDISQFNEKGRIEFIGLVVSQPEMRTENQKLVVDVLEIRLPVEVGSSKINGKVLITTERYPEYHYGQKLEIIGQLKSPKNFNDSSFRTSFDYQKYLAKDDIYSVIYWPEIKVLAENEPPHQTSTFKNLHKVQCLLWCENEGNPIKSFLFWLKNKFEESLAKVLSEPQFSLANGLILGERATLPKDLTDAFNVIGITHIIALSGFNITIIAESLRRFFNSLMISRNYSFWLAVIFIVGFVIMTGASPSVVRAAVMGILVILAQKTGRLYSTRNALVFAGLVMIFSNPKILRFDLGFQLSFLATLGLVYISPLFEKYFQRLPKTFDLAGIASVTLGAQIAVFPLIMFSFGRLSLIAPIANLLILPLIPQTMFWSFLSGLISWFWLGFGKIFSWLAWLFLSYEIKIAEILSKIPYASLNIKINWFWLVILYLILWGVVIRLRIKLQSKDFSSK